MKIKHLTLILSSAAILLFSGYSIMYPSGAPAAVTGSQGDGANCTKCHGGTATTTAGLVTSNIPASGYVAGQTYLITATNTLTGSGKYGFEVSPQNSTGTQLGTLVSGTGSKLVSGGTKYITQNSSGSTTNTWTFSWIAPISGTGQVTFYGAMARNYPGSVTLSSLAVQEALQTGLDENPAAIKVIAGESSGFINVVLNTNANLTKITVFDLSGRQLLSTSIYGGGTHQLEQKFKSGLYIIIVEADGTALKKKIVVI
jgi:hypothetical protein